jgi:predicted DNA-binding transcriptional regulator AlpA
MANPSERASGERLLRPIHVQRLLGIAASTLWNYVHQQGLLTPAQHTAGGHARYRESEVAALRARLSTPVEVPAEAAA